MRPKTNRLLMLLVGAAISGCASQTDRSSSGGGVETQPAPPPAYEPQKESVQTIDHPLPQTPPPKAAVVAAAPKDEPTPDFPVTKYELPADEEVEDLGPEEEDEVFLEEDESESAEPELTPAEEIALVETTEDEDAEDSDEIEGPVIEPDDSAPASLPQEKLAAADTVVDKPAPTVVTLNFETEPLFGFDQATVRADQGAKLDEFVSGLGGMQYDSIAVVGHADRIGKDAYNQKLSERRAAAVKAYLVKKGIASDKVRTEGRGEKEPLTGDACNKARGKALISCLQPDRRVDVSVSATKQ